MSLDTLFKTGAPVDEVRSKDAAPVSPFVMFQEQVVMSPVADDTPDEEYTD